MPGEVGFLTVTHVRDSNGYVSLYRAGSDRVTLVGQGVHFEASTGRVIREEPPPAPASAVNDFLTGLHLQHFEHWLLRWFYVLGGLAGCVCIATGFLFFVEKRRRRHAEQGLSGARWVDAMAVTTVTGIVIAALAILVANRLLPADLDHRDTWQKGMFWLAWLIAFAHAAWRSAAVRQSRIAPAWREQCWAITVLAVVAVLSNWATTGDHLVRTIASGYWPVAGLDLALLAAAGIAAVAAWRLRRREHLAAIGDLQTMRPTPPQLDEESSTEAGALLRRARVPDAAVPDAVLLGGAALTAVAGVAWFALAMDAHWHQVLGMPQVPPRTRRMLRLLGGVALAVSLALCMAADHPTMAALVWVMALAGGALVVAFTLSWRPQVLAALVAWTRRRPAPWQRK